MDIQYTDERTEMRLQLNSIHWSQYVSSIIQSKKEVIA